MLTFTAIRKLPCTVGQITQLIGSKLLYSRNIRNIIIMSSPKSKEPSKKEDDISSAARYATRGTLLNEHQKEVAEARKKFLEMKIDEKRKLYKCKDNFTVLSDVPTWSEYFAENLKEDDRTKSWWKVNAKNTEAGINEDLNEKISIFRGDITSLEIDAIANAANESLLGGGGVDGAIHAASGASLRSECELLNGCQVGEAKITCGYKLPAKHIIHTVGPRGEKPQALENAYQNCLNLLKKHKLKSLAFPCISTGIFGYPNLAAARVALSTIRKFVEEDEYGPEVERIIMCLFLKKDVEIYEEQMQLFFPLDRSKDRNENKPVESESPKKEKESTAKPADEVEKASKVESEPVKD